MKPRDLQPVRWLIIPEPLVGAILVGLIGRVYAVAEIDEQPVAPRRLIGPKSPTQEDGESLLNEALRLKREGYRYRHFWSF
jgi:hypothetical protein